MPSLLQQRDLSDHNHLTSVNTDGAKRARKPRKCQGYHVLEYICLQYPPSPFVYFWGSVKSELNMGV